MSGYGRDSGGGRDNDRYGGGYSNDHDSGRGGGRYNNDYGGGSKRNYSDYNSRSDGGDDGGSGSGSYNRSRQDDRGSGGYNRGRNDHDDDYGSRGGGGGYSRGRNDYSGGASGGNSYGGDDSRMETQRDTIFIQNLPKDVTTEALREAFSQIGLIKKDKKTGGPKIWIYKDKTTGEGKGEATVTYEDEQAAQAAIDWFDNKEVLSNIVKVSLATRRASAFGGRGGFRGGRGGFRGRGGGGGGGGGDFGGYRGRGGDRSGGGDYRGGGRGASHGSSRDNRSNPY